MQKYDIKTGMRKLTLDTKDTFAKKWETVIDEFFINTNKVPEGLPSNPQSRHESLVREQFCTIAADGRKFGLFLILVSQRPDNLDDLVLIPVR